MKIEEKTKTTYEDGRFTLSVNEEGKVSLFHSRFDDRPAKEAIGLAILFMQEVYNIL